MAYSRLVEETQKVLEGNYDTDTFKELEKQYGKPNKNFSEAELAVIKDKLATPDSRPMDFDGTFEAWLLRISLWGKIKITFKNPESNINKVVSQAQFLEYIGDDERNAAYGNWIIDGPEIDKITFHRKFWAINGKEVKEEMIVEIALRPDLKQKLKNVRKKMGLFGWKLFFNK